MKARLAFDKINLPAKAIYGGKHMMSENIKRLLYWGVYIFLLLVGMAIRWFDILPIVTTSIFLLGLYWMWTGISLLIRINPHYAQKHDRKTQLVFSAASISLGIVWVVMSFSTYSSRAFPMLVVSVPFLIPILFIRNR